MSSLCWSAASGKMLTMQRARRMLKPATSRATTQMARPAVRETGLCRVAVDVEVLVSVLNLGGRGGGRRICGCFRGGDRLLGLHVLLERQAEVVEGIEGAERGSDGVVGEQEERADDGEGARFLLG